MKKIIILAIIIVYTKIPSFGDITLLPHNSSFQDIKNLLVSNHWENFNTYQKVQGFREIVKKSRYGNRGLKNIFKNFRGEGYIDPNIPGVEKTISLVSSISRSQAKGAMRTLVYATKIYHHPEFELLGVNKYYRDKNGKILSDKDLLLRHKKTGVTYHIEVKDMKPSSQYADIKRLKRQIDLMAKDRSKNGEVKVWVNRHQTIPEIKNYAKRKGIILYENVGTGKMVKTDFEKNVLDDLSKRANMMANQKIIIAETGMGILIFATSSYNIYQEYQKEKPDLLKIGENAGWGLLGAGMILSGISPLNSSSQLLSNIGRLTGIVGLIIAEGFIVIQYNRGNITLREFSTTTAGIISAFIGAYGGSIIGTSIAGPIGGVIGGIIGGMIGYFAVQEISNLWYNYLDKQEKEKVFTNLYNYYNNLY